MRLGVPAKIFIPTIASPAKIARIRGYRADLVVGGSNIAEAFAASAAWAANSDALAIHPFEQRETVLGQATLGLEIEEQAPELEALLLPVGGGGLIAGIASWYERRIRVIGIEPEAAPTLTRALAAGRPVDAEMGGLAADSLAPPRVGEQGFAIAQRLVAGTLLVTDAQIRAAQQLLWEAFRIAAEPGGATAVAALISGRYEARPGERLGIVLTGANTDAVSFAA
jgi:threonine dehydratase